MNDDRPMVLIVDDEPLNLEFLVDTLQADYRIKATTHGTEALELARQPRVPR